MMKKEKEIRKCAKDSKKKLQEDENYAIQAGTELRKDIKAYKLGAIWALDWVLDKHN